MSCISDTISLKFFSNAGCSEFISAIDSLELFVFSSWKFVKASAEGVFVLVFASAASGFANKFSSCTVNGLALVCFIFSKKAS